MKDSIMEIKNVSTSFNIEGEFHRAVDDISFSVDKNEIIAIVGESGCGKSALALSLMGLHNKKKTKIEGTVTYKNQNVLNFTDKDWNKIRGNSFGMIFQEPLSALNPLMTIGNQIEEVLAIHTSLNKTERKDEAISLLTKVGIRFPENTYKQYPHELSGGMRQRVLIATAIACKPNILIADEPTTALDATIQAEILDLLKELQSDTNMSVILITHNIGVVADIADKVIVMYAGQIVEMGDVMTILKNPKHPYTRSLFKSIPSSGTKESNLHVIEGSVPAIKNISRTGCRFADRIPYIERAKHEENPTLHEVEKDHFVRCTCYQDFYFPNKDGA